MLEQLEAPAYKIASPEIFHIPLIEKVARTGKPVILSTGMAELPDIELAVETLKSEGCKHIVILKCTTAYPAPFNEINLATIVDIAKRFKCHAGLSDHSSGLSVPIAATALGASFIEKHFTIDEAGETVDSFFSLNEQDFSQMVTEIRNTEKSLGEVSYALTKSVKNNIQGRRSIYISKDIKKGDVFSKENIKVVRPGFGLHPKHYNEVLGRCSTDNLSTGDRLDWDKIKYE